MTNKIKFFLQKQELNSAICKKKLYSTLFRVTAILLRRNSRKLLRIVKISNLAINLLILTNKWKNLLKIVGYGILA